MARVARWRGAGRPSTPGGGFPRQIPRQMGAPEGRPAPRRGAQKSQTPTRQRGKNPWPPCLWRVRHGRRGAGRGWAPLYTSPLGGFSARARAYFCKPCSLEWVLEGYHWEKKAQTVRSNATPDRRLLGQFVYPLDLAWFHRASEIIGTWLPFYNTNKYAQGEQAAKTFFSTGFELGGERVSG